MFSRKAVTSFCVCSSCLWNLSSIGASIFLGGWTPKRTGWLILGAEDAAASPVDPWFLIQFPHGSDCKEGVSCTASETASALANWKTFCILPGRITGLWSPLDWIHVTKTGLLFHCGNWSGIFSFSATHNQAVFLILLGWHTPILGPRVSSPLRSTLGGPGEKTRTKFVENVAVVYTTSILQDFLLENDPSWSNQIWSKH